MAQKRLLGNVSKLAQKTVKILLVVAAIALLCSTSFVAELVAKQKFINVPVDLFQKTAWDIFMISIGGIVVAFSAIIILPSFKMILFVSGLALMAASAYKLYRVFIEKKNP